ncbi:MAG: hypothetical protein QM763_20865 [Agriterribacter sp.]
MLQKIRIVTATSLFDGHDAGHIKIFGGGGGTILPKEIEELHQYGITRIYSPNDGRKMGLEGMIEDVIMLCNDGHTQQKNSGKRKWKISTW